MRNSSPLLAYLNTPIRYYYFYLIPLGLALLMVSFDVHFQGVFPSTIASNLSSPHKFLNDFFGICTFICIALIFINYFRVQLNRQQIQHIKLHYAKLNWLVHQCIAVENTLVCMLNRLCTNPLYHLRVDDMLKRMYTLGQTVHTIM